MLDKLNHGPFQFWEGIIFIYYSILFNILLIYIINCYSIMFNCIHFHHHLLFIIILYSFPFLIVFIGIFVRIKGEVSFLRVFEGKIGFLRLLEIDLYMVIFFFFLNDEFMFFSHLKYLTLLKIVILIKFIKFTLLWWTFYYFNFQLNFHKFLFSFFLFPLFFGLSFQFFVDKLETLTNQTVNQYQQFL
jgi:hypothetical protein